MCFLQKKKKEQIKKTTPPKKKQRKNPQEPHKRSDTFLEDKD